MSSNSGPAQLRFASGSCDTGPLTMMMRQQINLVDSDTTQAFPTSDAHSYEGNRVATTAWGPASRITGLAGHFWTARSGLFSRVRELPYSAPFRCAVPSVRFGRIQLSGILCDQPESDTLVLILHGAGGHARSPCCAAAAEAAASAHLSSLRLSMRGADGSGEDIYHGGLTSDIQAALGIAQLGRYRSIVLLGYSMGGHTALMAAIEQADPRITAVAAISAPLNLGEINDFLDARERRLYRHYLWSRYDRNYAALEARQRAPTPLARLRKARSGRERDSLTIVPRFGFADANEYYHRASVATHIQKLAIRVLLVQSQNDPIVPLQGLRSVLEHAPSCLTVRWLDTGGHVSFPPNLNLGQQAPLGLEHQVIRWLSKS